MSLRRWERKRLYSFVLLLLAYVHRNSVLRESKRRRYASQGHRAESLYRGRERTPFFVTTLVCELGSEPRVLSVFVPRCRRLRVVAFLGCRCLHRHGATLLTANLYIADMCAFGVINQA